MCNLPVSASALHPLVRAETAEALLHPPVRSLVSVRRQLATVLLATHALLSLPGAERGGGGDLVETGVFHGGTTVLLARVLHNLSSHRVLWSADSFQGLPRTQTQDRGNCSAPTDALPRRSCGHGRLGNFRSPRSTVERALRQESLSHHVRIVPGWFHETLPPHGLHSIAFLRLDGDTYNGTYEALSRLYPLVVKGGVVYVDDAGSFRGANEALVAYFGRATIGSKIKESEGYYEAVWWRKGGCSEKKQTLTAPRGRGRRSGPCSI